MWYIGKDALAKQEEHGGILLTNLLENACKEEVTEVNLESYESAALLALYIKRSLTYLSLAAPLEKIAAIMFVVESLDLKTVDVCFIL